MVKKRAESREGMVVTTVALSKALHRRLVIAGLEEEAAATELMRVAIQEYLDKRDRAGRRRRKR